MEHLSWSIDMSDHVNFWLRGKILYNSSCELRLAIGNADTISNSMYTLAKSEKTKVYRWTLLNISFCFIDSLATSKVNDGDGDFACLNFEDGMGARAFFIGLGVRLIAIDNVLFHHLSSRLFCDILWLVFIELVKCSSFFRT